MACNLFARNTDLTPTTCFILLRHSPITSTCISAHVLPYITLLNLLIGVSVRSASSFSCYANFSTSSLIFAHQCMIENWITNIGNLRSTPLDCFKLNVSLYLGQEIVKQDTTTAALLTLVMETMDALYPKSNWLKVFSNGSFLSDQPNAGAGVFL
ncbi:hypothetical protein TNCV_4058931 [Trichonephila clavipes]|nr:hypothetical protein TNCV_4058931 [Trichonephila clavipes]